MNYGNIAFIPLRGGSKSIPFKNIKKINGRPLVYWVLDAVNACKYIEKIFVATDSEEIKKVVQDYGSDKILVVERSKQNAEDNASTESAMLEFARQYDFDNIVLVQATSPLLEEVDLNKGFEMFLNEKYDSILSVVKQKRFIWALENGQATSQNYDFNHRPRRQEFEGFYVENGAFYITSKEALIKNENRISGHIGLVEMSEESYFEIDEVSDWIIVENFLKSKTDRNVFQLATALKKIKAVFMDCDGVLTDGGMYYSENGDELKKFNTKDGMGIQLLRENNILTGVITGETTELVKKRCEKLKINEIHMGIKNKLEVINQLKIKYELKDENIAYIGDDINDLETIIKVGFGCCVADAMESIKGIADYITEKKGGDGAVREIAEVILKFVHG